ncbi:hypothetical protein M569_01070, partial [Genlisea aurea]
SLRKRTRAPDPAAAVSEDDDDVCCEKCGSGQRPAELLLCDKCDSGFHTFCLRPVLAAVPRGKWFCPHCSSNDEHLENFPLVQTKIVDFFRIQRSSHSSSSPTVSPESKRRRKRATGIVFSKKKRKLLAFLPSEDPARRLQQMASLATALTATGTQFSSHLTYTASAPRSANSAALEKDGMQLLPKHDAQTLRRCNQMMDRGEWPPLMVVYDPQEGFTVEADRFIRDLTIIAEYVGDVDFLKNREEDGGDSMMTLLTASDPSKSLVICPDRRSNIARFINGINNHVKGGKKKMNVKCVRFDVDGECRVLLIAARDIRKGERLYYDYNGYENEYPTHHFL